MLSKLEQIEGSFKAIFYNNKGEEIANLPLKEVVQKIPEIKNAETLVMDGIITARIVQEAEKAGIKTIIGIKTTARDNRGIKIISAGNQR